MQLSTCSSPKSPNIVSQCQITSVTTCPWHCHVDWPIFDLSQRQTEEHANTAEYTIHYTLYCKNPLCFTSLVLPLQSP